MWFTSRFCARTQNHARDLGAIGKSGPSSKRGANGAPSFIAKVPGSGWPGFRRGAAADVKATGARVGSAFRQDPAGNAAQQPRRAWPTVASGGGPRPSGGDADDDVQ